MSGPIRFMILAIALGIKKLGYVCFVRKLCSVQSIHTELAKLYSQKVISRMGCPADLWGRKFDPSVLFQQTGNKSGTAAVVLNECNRA